MCVSACLSISLSVCICVYLSVCMSGDQGFVARARNLPVCLCLCLSVCMYVSVSVYLSVCVYSRISVCQGFVQNQARARNLQDVSVLPDLCTSHRRQLSLMLKNHQSLQDIHRRCAAAKDELSANLHARLRSLSLSVCKKRPI